MSSDKNAASEAPDEMVNVKLPAPAPGAQGEELPLRLAVIGDFKQSPDDTPISERKPQSIDSKNMDQVMASMNLGLEFPVANKISGGENEQIPVKLKIDSMNSFRPEEVAKQVPQIRNLVELRERLVTLKQQATQDPEKLKDFNNILKELGLDKLLDVS